MPLTNTVVVVQALACFVFKLIECRVMREVVGKFILPAFSLVVSLIVIKYWSWWWWNMWLGLASSKWAMSAILKPRIRGEPFALWEKDQTRKVVE